MQKCVGLLSLSFFLYLIGTAFLCEENENSCEKSTKKKNNFVGYSQRCDIKPSSSWVKNNLILAK